MRKIAVNSSAVGSKLAEEIDNHKTETNQPTPQEQRHKCVLNKRRTSGISKQMSAATYQQNAQIYQSV
jgi:hypothetical protein